jgi:hypothetical protein
VITKDGRPLVILVPAEIEDGSIFGYLAGKAKIVGDIVSPVTPLEEWEKLR